jgi:hypothetical protein
MPACLKELNRCVILLHDKMSNNFAKVIDVQGPREPVADFSHRKRGSSLHMPQFF